MRKLLITLLFIPTLSFAQTKEDVLKEIKRQSIPHPHIVLAQARLESGNMKSDFYKRTNNLFGLKKGNRYASYKHWKHSVTDYRKRISSRYDRRKDRTYYAFLRRINYASDKEYFNKIKEILK